ncbi:hypothetical protein ACFJIY_11215 [Pimelobacter simplex]|uniref:hypothetical protein n=1 Tax=Nocardioides simplex TaxID=2045 RepID=UPI00366C572E
MAQEDGLDEVDDGVLLVVVELVERFEVEAEPVIGGTALIFVEDQSVGADEEADVGAEEPSTSGSGQSSSTTTAPVAFPCRVK